MDKAICEKCGSISYFDHYFGRYVCSNCHHSQARDAEKVHCPSCGCELSLAQWGNKGYTYAGNHAIDCYVGTSKLFDTPEAALTAAQKRWVEKNRVLEPDEIVQLPTDSEGFLSTYIDLRDGERIYASIIYTPHVLLDDYGKTYRCWLRKPTDEERQTAPWEGGAV